MEALLQSTPYTLVVIHVLPDDVPEARERFETVFATLIAHLPLASHADRRSTRMFVLGAPHENCSGRVRIAENVDGFDLSCVSVSRSDRSQFHLREFMSDVARPRGKPPAGRCASDLTQVVVHLAKTRHQCDFWADYQ
jgi:hypothetical protein